jgi:MFS transporter, DHA1 family, multidrug resistance protein
MPSLRRALVPRLPRLLRGPGGRQRRHGQPPSRTARSQPGTAGDASPQEKAPGAAVDWRRNLAALWIAEFFAIFGFSFVFPFMPLYLHQDMGIASESQLAFWTGLCTGVSGVSMAVASPIWGVLADRHGRKQMLLRAMLGGAIPVLLMGLCHDPWQLAVLRFFQGATSGTVAAATALVAGETPRQRVVWALGVLSSSIALGGAVGPMVGGLAGALFGLRWIFLCGGVLLLLALIPVWVVVRETPRAAPAEARPSSLGALRHAGKPTLVALGVLVGAQCLMQFSYVSSQQMVVLRVLHLAPASANLITGIGFGLAGIATAAASAFYARIARRIGYRGFAAISALLLAGVIGAAALVQSVALIVVAVMLGGLVYGCVSPVLAGMIGLETPRSIQATVYGLSASAISAGLAAGPVLVGTVAAATNPSWAMLVAAAVGVLLFVLLAVAARNPAPPAPAQPSSPAAS